MFRDKIQQVTLPTGGFKDDTPISTPGAWQCWICDGEKRQLRYQGKLGVRSVYVCDRCDGPDV